MFLLVAVETGAAPPIRGLQQAAADALRPRYAFFLFPAFPLLRNPLRCIAFARDIVLVSLTTVRTLTYALSCEIRVPFQPTTHPGFGPGEIGLKNFIEALFREQKIMVYRILTAWNGKKCVCNGNIKAAAPQMQCTLEWVKSVGMKGLHYITFFFFVQNVLCNLSENIQPLSQIHSWGLPIKNGPYCSFFYELMLN